MAIRVLTFDPLDTTDVERFEHELDFYLGDGWEVLSTVAGNRAGVTLNTEQLRSSMLHSPEYRDYVVFVLRKTDSERNH